MIWTLLLFLFLIIYPGWLFIKLARYGKGVFRPNFERMQRKVDEWTRFPNTGAFAYNRIGGKLLYYLLLFCLAGAISFIIYSLAK